MGGVSVRIRDSRLDTEWRSANGQGQVRARPYSDVMESAALVPRPVSPLYREIYRDLGGRSGDDSPRRVGHVVIDARAA